MFSEKLIQKFPIISDQISAPALKVVLAALEKVLQAEVPGAVIEFGCYVGTTSLFVRRLLDELGQGSREFHVYDSFEGLPPKGREDQSAAGVDFRAGELAISKKQFLKEFYKAGLRPPIIHKAWFNDLAPSEIPAPIAFAFLDGDFYDSILKSLQLVWPRLSDGAVVCLDDYGRETLPGVERAAQDFFKNNLPQLSAPQNIAIIRK